MKYKNVEVESLSLTCFLGDMFKEIDFKSNQDFFMEQIKGFSFNCGIECPIEDLICVYINDVSGTGKNDIKTIVKACEEMKKYFDDTFINLYLEDFIDGEGNSIDLTIDEFEKLYFEH